MLSRRTAVGLMSSTLIGCNNEERPVLISPVAPELRNNSEQAGENLYKTVSNLSPYALPRVSFVEGYARFKITAKSKQEGWNDTVSSNSSNLARDFWRSIKSQFGDRITNYGIVLKIPTQGDNITYPIISLSYNLSRNRLEYIKKDYYTPWFKIQSSSNVMYTLEA